MDIDNQTVSTTLPIELDSKWVHMNNIEREKLEWMKDLPKPSAQRTVDDSVRYNRSKDSLIVFFFCLESRRCSSSFRF
jgi:hypothetical protein